MGFWKQIQTYFYIKKRDPNEPKNLDIKFMHGMNRISLFMFLVVSMLNTYGFGAGIRLILTGLIIISVILLASGPKATR